VLRVEHLREESARPAAKLPEFRRRAPDLVAQHRTEARRGHSRRPGQAPVSADALGGVWFTEPSYRGLPTTPKVPGEPGQAPCNAREVSEWAGHNDVAFALTRYGGLVEDGSVEAVARLGALLESRQTTLERGRTA
jgi:hypothetical protein